jgi:hypothetical protein
MKIPNIANEELVKKATLGGSGKTSGGAVKMDKATRLYH